MEFSAPARRPRGPLPRTETPIVPADSIGGRALVAVVAIMTFLAAMTTGSVMMIRNAAVDWQSEVSREVTIQVRPGSGDVEADVQKAAEIARAFPGLSDARVYSREESARLLEPWLGSGLSMEDLPVPRVIVLRFAGGQPPDLSGLRRNLAAAVPAATLDDHRGWIERMRAMANAAVVTGAVILLLVLAAMILSVTFATRGAMASNRPVVEVLHLVGARDGFIAAEFQRHFLVLGFKGGLLGGGAAMALFALAGLLGGWLAGTAAGDQLAALFGSFSIGWEGYAALLILIVVAAAVTAGTSRHTVNQTLETV
ncbi:MAG: ABC transporter permease [Pseudorhodoplanes sp.]|nr:ABC transporter permease [Pseudorhodoplanes sp.]MCL4709725.1 ABC transporter permease [Pseudorhodoplanes sp.]MCQ3941605.1 ABC transporter permease [Alphaproteobacteria bacterium]